MERRRFIQTTCLGLCGLPLIVQSSCSPLPLIRARLDQNQLRIPLAGLPTGTRHLVRSAALEHDILLHVLEGPSCNALYLRCTHQNQPLSVSNQAIHCASHGSTFDFEGKATKAPANKALLKLKAEVQNAEIVIQIPPNL